MFYVSTVIEKEFHEEFDKLGGGVKSPFFSSLFKFGKSYKGKSIGIVFNYLLSTVNIILFMSTSSSYINS